MKTCVLGVFVCGCLVVVYGQLVTLEYIVKNTIVEPRFVNSIQISIPSGVPLMRAMELAADKNKIYDFTTAYSSEIGYLVTTINGLQSNYAMDNTYWEIFNKSNIYIKGVSYIPSNGDIVTFNFTRG